MDNNTSALIKKREKEERKRAYEAEKANLKKLFLLLFCGVAVLSLLALILLLCTDVVFVHNTDMTENGGRENSVGGIAFLEALFTGNYTSPDFDNIAVPYYLYAKSYCQPTAILTLFTLIFLALTLIISALCILFTCLKREYALSPLVAVFAVLTFIMTVVLYSTALSMKGSQILPEYCNSNPACSIRSDMIWCLLLSLLSLGGAVFATVRYFKLRAMRPGAKGKSK